MAASIDSTAHLTPPHHRSRRTPSPTPTFDSLRTSLSQVSLQDTLHRTTAVSSSTTSLPGLLPQNHQRQRTVASSTSSSYLKESNRSHKSHQTTGRMRPEEESETSRSRPSHPVSSARSSNNNHSSKRDSHTSSSKSTAARKAGFYSQNNNSSSHLLHLDSTTDDIRLDSTKPTLPALQITTDKSWSSSWAREAFENTNKDDTINKPESDDDSYFNVLGEYCNSDDDPTSPSTASPTSPFSGRKGFMSPQPPTPPVSSGRRFERRDPFAVQSPSRRAAAAPLRNASGAQPTEPPPASTQSPSSSSTSSLANSPMMAASAKFSNFLQSSAVRSSRDSFTLHDASSSSLSLPGTAITTSNNSTGSTPRSYSKRPVPAPTLSTTNPASKSNSTEPSKTTTSSTLGWSSYHELNHSTPDLRPEPPLKDNTRRALGNAHNNNNTINNNIDKNNSSSNNNSNSNSNNKNTSGSNGTSHLPLTLGDSHLSDSLTSFSAVVEATMEQRRRNASVSSVSSSTVADVSPYADNAASLGTTISSHNHSSHNNATYHGTEGSSSNKGKSSSRPSQLNYLTNGRSRDRTSGSNQQQQHQHHQHLYHQQGQNNSATSLSRGQSPSQSDEQAFYRQQQRQHLLQANSARPYDASSITQYSSSSPALYSSNGTSSITPSDMLSNRLNNNRIRSHSQGSIATTNSLSTSNNYPNNTNNSSAYTNSNSNVESYQYQHFLAPNPHKRHYGGTIKPAIIKTPIARSRARETKGPRKVIFGDMITIVTIERPDTPPPPPSVTLSEKEKKKANKKKSKKEGKNSDKTGPHPDPEYDEAYYNQPYTPTPADVLVTLAPWIGNPNYDEERANSKFYEDDTEYEYDEDGYEYEDGGHGGSFDIRSGPGDEEDEDEEDDEDLDRGRAWGNGIAGGVQAKKKNGGGMFKFKKAVNRLLRN
ncbi:hypothetical protein FBU30_006151 [Linnemannia zychae]|nr:hypothetical protein FBU30_006151 [Linnemannia zychae]